MILQTFGSMGDILMMSGIPQLYYEMYGEKTKIGKIHSKEFWINNPYVTEERNGNTLVVRPNFSLNDYMQYYPQRVFEEITGVSTDRDKVQPNIYTPRKPIKKTIIISDQAGWPSRRGYRYFNELVSKLMDNGYYVYYLRHEQFRDCIGKVSERQINIYSGLLENLTIAELIDKMSEAEFYIGYESGLSTLAGALKLPYVNIYGSIPAINTAHNSCILAIDNCDHCCTDRCAKGKYCISKYDDYSEEILKRIKEYGS